MYSKFKEQLITEGVAKWRCHEAHKDIAVLNDISTTTGEYVIKCTCAIYKMIQHAAHQENPIFPEEEMLPDATFTCIHCRYLKEKLLNAYNEATNVESINIPKQIQMVRDSLHIINKDVFLLGDILPIRTTKFSVKGDDSYSIVNFTFSHGRCGHK